MRHCNAIGRIWIAFGVLVACAAPAAVIFKWTDKDGLIHYSDQSVPGAEKIVTSSGSNNGIGGANRGSLSSGSSLAKPPLSRLDYAAFSIDSPAKDQAFFGDELVPVRLHLEPDLKPQQGLTWQLNGAPLDERGNSLDFALPALPRGTYTLSAVVTDLVSGETQHSEVTFFVRQPSELAPLHKKF